MRTRTGASCVSACNVSDALGCGEQPRIDRGRADDLANLSHRPAHGVEEATAGILHEVPPVGDLDSLRQSSGDRLAVSAPSVAGDDLDRGILLQQHLRGRRLAVREERYDTAAFEIADQGAVAVVAAPGEVVDADDAARIGACGRPAADDAQERISTDGQHEALGEARTGSTTECEREVMDYLLQPRGASREGRQDVVGEALSEDLSPT
jgi:hypothetical protein